MTMVLGLRGLPNPSSGTPESYKPTGEKAYTNAGR